MARAVSLTGGGGKREAGGAPRAGSAAAALAGELSDGRCVWQEGGEQGSVRWVTRRLGRRCMPGGAQADGEEGGWRGESREVDVCRCV